MNLLSCENEPIHIPGRIQSHGFLLAFDSDSFAIRYASENTKTVAGIPAVQLLGKNFWDFLNQVTNVSLPAIRNQLDGWVHHHLDAKDYALIDMKSGHSFHLVFSLSDDLFLAEFEALPHDELITSEDADAFSRILSFDTIAKSADYLCNRIRKFTQFDRVMVYQFDDDYNGEVIAEAAHTFNHTFLHHHFPASDIPAQARKLYRQNRMRLIRDVDDPGVELISCDDLHEPLDLTWSILRSVSPIHIRYLKNMGVSASYSISIVHKEKLWGLVTCHNLTARHIPLQVRNFCKTISDIFAANIENLHVISKNRKAASFASALTDATTQVILTGDVRAILNKRLNDATGAAYVRGDSVQMHGQVPSLRTIRKIAELVAEKGGELFHTKSLRAELPDRNKEDDRSASGVLALLLSEKGKEVLMWFKPEVESTIKWAGKPEKVYQDFEGSEVLNPRNSFETWSQNFTGMSAGWNSGEIEIAKTLSKEILKINQERSDAIKQLHEKLQEAYEELSTFSYTVSHDLKTPLTAVKNYAQLLIMKETLSVTGEKFTGKIIASADKMRDFIDDLFSYTRVGFASPVKEQVDVKQVVTAIVDDFHAIYGDKFVVQTGSLPRLQSDKTFIYQIFSNLIGNAIKYSLRKDHPLVTVECEENQESYSFLIRDNGIGMPKDEIQHLFTRFYRLSNARRFEGTGLGLAITRRIVEKLGGSISISSEENVGTECRVTIPK